MIASYSIKTSNDLHQRETNHECSFLASECVDSTIKWEDLGIMCILDIEKAYDHVNCEFLLKVLKRNRLWGKMVDVDWFMYKKIVRFSILVHGEATGFFPSERGHK